MSSADLPGSLGAVPPNAPPEDAPDGALARFAGRLTDLSERFIPDAFVFALLATVVVFLCALAFTEAPALELVKIWGDGFWELTAFTMQPGTIKP